VPTSATDLARAATTPAAEEEPASSPAAVQTAAVAPNVVGSARAPLMEAGPPPAPHVDTAALLETLSERTAGSAFSFQSTSGWGEDRQSAAFDRWADVGPIEEAPRLMSGDDVETRVQTSSDTFGQAVMATHVTPEMFGVLLDTRASRKYRFMPASVSSARSQWAFLERHGARETGTSNLVLDGVLLQVTALRLSDGAPAESCLAFVGYLVSRRVDGFLCRAAGPALEVAQASTVLSQIRVPWFIDP
jgi:hypothetical protein